MVGPIFFPSLKTESCLRVSMEADNEDVVTPKKPTISMRRVWGYSIVREEDSLITTVDLETRE